MYTDIYKIILFEKNCCNFPAQPPVGLGNAALREAGHHLQDLGHQGGVNVVGGRGLSLPPPHKRSAHSSPEGNILCCWEAKPLLARTPGG